MDAQVGRWRPKGARVSGGHLRARGHWATDVTMDRPITVPLDARQDFLRDSLARFIGNLRSRYRRCGLSAKSPRREHPGDNASLRRYGAVDAQQAPGPIGHMDAS
jgi:hypothetical protein